MSRVIHQSTVRGDDQHGDGSLEFPYATISRAHRDAQPGDIVAYDSALLADTSSSASWGTDWEYVACWVVCLAMVAVVCAAIAAKVVGL